MPRLSTISYGRASLFGIVALAFISWGLYSAIEAIRSPSSIHLRLAAGSSVARRFQIAESFAAEARKSDLYVDVIATKGFEDSVRQISEGKVDLALVSSGLETSACKDLRVLAGLGIAPLHILVRRELADRGLPLVEVIKGHQVNLGQPGTNDYMLANELVRFLRLSAMDASGHGDYTLSSMSKEELSQRAHSIRSQSVQERQASLQSMPDVIMVVVSLPSLVVQDLLDSGGYCLVPFPHAEPFLLSELQHVSGAEAKVDRMFVDRTKINSGMYFSNSSATTTDCATVGLRTLLIARADLPAATVKRVMQSVFESDFTRRVRPQSPREFAAAYHTHDAADVYLDRDKPLVTGKFFETITKSFSIFGAFSAGALSIYGYLRRRRIRRPGEYLEEIRKIDALASGQDSESEPRLSPDALSRQVEARLNQLKEQVIRDYCDNRVQGEMVLLSILSTLADSRSRLHVATIRPGSLKTTVPNDSRPWANASGNNLSQEQITARAA